MKAAALLLGAAVVAAGCGSSGSSRVSATDVQDALVSDGVNVTQYAGIVEPTCRELGPAGGAPSDPSSAADRWVIVSGSNACDELMKADKAARLIDRNVWVDWISGYPEDNQFESVVRVALKDV